MSVHALHPNVVEHAAQHADTSVILSMYVMSFPAQSMSTKGWQDDAGAAFDRYQMPPEWNPCGAETSQGASAGPS